MEADLSKSIAIIGGGIFGCAIAEKLSAIGYDCTIYDKRNVILGGTACSNLFRAHRGPHYPRSKETALQCLDSYEKFLFKFRECIDTSFSNYYVISSERSNTTFKNFLKFCSSLNIPHKVIQKQDHRSIFKNGDGGILCKEGSINIFRMRDHYMKVLADFDCEVRLNKKIMSMCRNKNKIVLKTDEQDYEADIVINCSFTDMNLAFETMHPDSTELVYQRTVCFKYKTLDPLIGFTVMDGKFPTLFPTFWDKDSTELDTYVVYHVEHSVCREEISVLYPEFDPITPMELQERYDLTLKDINKYLPSIPEKIGKVEFLIGDRVIRPHVKNSDTRFSEIIKMADNYFVVFQGKMETSLKIADQIAELL